MKWKIISLIQILILCSTLSLGAIPKLPSVVTKARIAQYLDKYAKDHHIPCFLVGYHVFTTENNNSAIVAEDRWIHSNTGGLADIENEVKCVAESTMLKVSSVTKPITATLISKLVEEGKLSWDDDINRYIPESVFPKKVVNGKV